MAEEEKVTPVAGEATSMADYEKELEALCYEYGLEVDN